MEKRLNKKIETYVSSFKDNIRDKAKQLGLTENEQVNMLIQYIYDYERISLDKNDFAKRKRVKNIVPIFERCCAKRASDEQCTRRRKEGSEYCGTHLKGTPHGTYDNVNNQNNTQKIEVWAEDIQGIVYYIDKFGNVYEPEDIISNKINPKIIAKYVKNWDHYTIPEFYVN